MTVSEDPQVRGGLAPRAKAIVMRPAATWAVIDDEPATIKGLYLGYVAPLAAIGPVCHSLGRIIFGATGSLGLTYRPPVTQVVAFALLGYLLTLAGVYAFAVIIEALAPYFGAQKSRIQAFKLAAYSGTAAWLTGVFNLYPPLAVLTAVGAIYSLYLLYLGVPRLMKAPEDKALLYTGAAIIVAIAVAMLVGILVSLLLTPLLLLTGGFAP
jgi:hypothetical protein